MDAICPDERNAYIYMDLNFGFVVPIKSPKLDKRKLKRNSKAKDKTKLGKAYIYWNSLILFNHRKRKRRKQERLR